MVRLPQFVAGPNGSTLALTLAVSDYDHARDLTGGLIRPEGIALTSLILPIEEMAYRWLKNWEFDAAETSFAKFVTLAGTGAGAGAASSPLVGLPVFLVRTFRHASIYIRRDSGIAAPKDLEGRSVAIPEWAQTAGVYVRGMLSEHHGVALDKVRWVQAGVNEPGRVEKVRFALPPSISYEPRPDRSISEMLASGEVDAAITARPPESFLQGHPRVSRLFPNFRTEEEAYFDATRIFPIMHIVALRRAVFEAHPWVARNLLTAFEKAKDAAVARVTDITASHVPLPWGAAVAGAGAAPQGAGRRAPGVGGPPLALWGRGEPAHAGCLLPLR